MLNMTEVLMYSVHTVFDGHTLAVQGSWFSKRWKTPCLNKLGHG